MDASCLGRRFKAPVSSRRSVADTIAANLRPTDTVARLGGDEMAVIMPDTEIATARQIAARLVAAIGGLRLGKGSAMITVSIGMATLAAASDDAEALMSRADAALYRAKHLGRNRVAA